MKISKIKRGGWEKARHTKHEVMKSAKEMFILQQMTEGRDKARENEQQRDRVCEREINTENGKLNYTVVMVVSWYPVIKPKQK